MLVRASENVFLEGRLNYKDTEENDSCASESIISKCREKLHNL